jgi:RNA polymerase sigma-70 factor (ECF subfamily)
MASEPPSGGGDFGEIAEQHRAMLLRVAVRLSGNAEIAKDLVQDTLLRGLSRFDQFQSGTHAGSWLVKILTNLYFDQLKHEKVVRNAEPQLMVPEAVECDWTVAEIADTDLVAAVGALEPDLREVVELCYLEQMSYREAAAVLGAPLGTIGTRLMRARTQLRVLLTTATRDAVNQ